MLVWEHLCISLKLILNSGAGGHGDRWDVRRDVFALGGSGVLQVWRSSARDSAAPCRDELVLCGLLRFASGALFPLQRLLKGLCSCNGIVAFALEISPQLEYVVGSVGKESSEGGRICSLLPKGARDKVC